MRFLLAIGIGLMAITTSQPVVAYSIVVAEGHYGSAKHRKHVKEAVERAPAIIDGEVVRPLSNSENALVRVHKSYKGDLPEVIEVGDADGDSCAIRLERKSERSRMILWGGPDVFTLYRDQSDARIEDKFLKSDRRKVWPYVAGEEPASKP